MNVNMNMKTALTIAGSDSSGGAGIQADIKTMALNGVFAMSAITAMTAQNTTGVFAVQEATPEFLRQQLDAVFSDIFPDAIKIGMVSSSGLIHTIAEALKLYKAKNIVADPVMVATSGAKLIDDDAINTLAEELLPLAAVITPNIPEAEILSGMKIHNQEDMIAAAKIMNAKFGCSVLVKGGHDVNDANDLLFSSGEVKWFMGKRINTNNTHGTGCTLSSAIAANLAKGFALDEAVNRSKEYISGALSAMLDLGRGCGPMNHCFNLTGKFAQSETIRGYLMDSVKDIWHEYNNHPFVKGLESGDLAPEKFRHYIIQDYLYLNEYSKVFALGAAKASKLDTMKFCVSIIDAIANVEMNIHNGYMGRLGVTRNEIENTPRSLANMSYTSYMIRIAYEEGEAEILAAILSCALSYEDIAKNIVKNNPDAINHELYGDWIKNYSGEEYCNANKLMLQNFEESVKDYNASQLEHIAEIFRTCSLYEMGFWDMAWEGK
ncbi:MAG: bifunctional hydroxymethylpyrimidine kinase/phosphomethylpyrimidine kinase [Synergistaceae bacterium]|nr:bifunctional hydroxymethylpyrimidine kinase/phosphomethylpyrimidine kinase [Synergistaceae bacterium]